MKSLLIFLIILNSITIILQLSTLFISPWVSIDNRSYSLTQCTSCSGLKSNWNFECLARESCQEKSSDCSTLTDFFNASKIYTYFQVLSIFLGLLFIEKLFLMVFSLNFGTRSFFHIFSFIHLACLFVSIFSWTFISSVESSEISVGAVFTFITGAWGISCFLFTNWVIFKEKTQENTKFIIETPQICGIDAKIYTFISLLFGALTLACIISGVINKEWIKGEDFIGSLTKCKDCYEVKWMNWSCMKEYHCEIDDNSDICGVYEKLSRSEAVYTPIQIISVFFLLLSFQQGSAILISQQYGCAYLSRVYIGLAFALNIIGTLVYGLITEVKFKSDCNDGICGGDGYVIIIISNFFLGFYFVLSLIVQRRIYNKKFSSITFSDRTLNMTGRRESYMIGNIISDSANEVPENGEKGDDLEMQETSRRSSSSQLLKPNTMNPEYAATLNIPK